MKNLIYLLFLLLLNSCITGKTVVTDSPYSENLTKNRLTYKDTVLAIQTTNVEEETIESPNILPTKHQNQSIDEFLGQIAESNKKVKYSLGYKVQIYSGRESAAAQKAVNKAAGIAGEKSEMEYEQPTYKVKVGNFVSRLEAYEVYVKLRKDFSDAFIIQDKIILDINK